MNFEPFDTLVDQKDEVAIYITTNSIWTVKLSVLSPAMRGYYEKRFVGLRKLTCIILFSFVSLSKKAVVMN